MIFDLILIKRTCLQTREEELKHTGITQTLHLMASAIPHIKVTDYADAHGTGCPHRKINTLYSVNGHRVCTHLAVYIVIDPGTELFQLCIGVLRRKGIRILQFFHSSVVIRHF